MLSYGLAGKEYAFKLYVLNLVPVLNGILYGGLSYVYSGAVYKDINMSELFDDLIDKGVNAFFCGDVSGYSVTYSACLFHYFLSGLVAVCLVPAGNNGNGSGVHKALCYSFSKTLASSDDKGVFAFK